MTIHRPFTLSLVALLCLSFSCSNTSNDKGKAMKYKVSDSFDQALFEKNIPTGWKVNVHSIKRLPFQWDGEAGDALRVHYYKNDTPELKSKSYEELYPQGKGKYKAIPQMVRYLFKDLNAGYKFGMMVRSHPDQLVAVTKDFVILSPTQTSTETDQKVSKELEEHFRKTVGINERNPMEFGQRINGYRAPMAKKTDPKKYPGKKALLFSKKKHGEENLWIETLAP